MTIKGYVEHIIYRNEDNGYTVFVLNNDDGDTTCMGNFLSISEGEGFKLEGEYITHASYGTQFKINSHEIREPDDAVSVERYLGSGAIKGVGPALAAKIVKKFKGDTFRIVEEEPERLIEIKGISERLARQISEQVEEKREARNAMIYLQKYGISTALSAKVYQHFGSKIYGVIEENPYKIADEIAGVGFKTADEIAEKVGILVDSDFRISSGIFFTLNQCTMEGHVYLPQSVLLARASKLLGVEVGDMDKHLMDLAMEKKIILKQEEYDVRVYPANLYYMELNSAKMLHDLKVNNEVAAVTIEHKIHQIEKDAQLQLEDKQVKAVVSAVQNGLLVVTGGPGTGKTTTINAMIKYFESEEKCILLAAPTGRAAKRMTETTGCEASTIHRLLEMNGNPEEEGSLKGFAKSQQNPLEADVIIIDEVSMVDIGLMHALLSAIIPGTKLILVGDKNQLPSVGPGSVLKDMIQSESVPVVELSKIFRQSSESHIIINAHKINNGEEVIVNNKSKDFFLLKRYDENMIISNIIELVKEKMPRYVGADPNDIQVLTPMRKGLVGVERLNKILQEYLNPEHKSKDQKEYGERIFRVGDKVMQIKNNYQIEWEVSTKFGLVTDKGLGVFNGDTGIITKINNYDQSVEVTYDDVRKVKYSFKMLDELEHAYAITIHKSQGSEYPAVVIPLLPGPRLLYNRNLLYTAITRAKQCVTIVGDDEVFQEMIRNENEQKRYTSFSERIQEF